MRFENGTRMIFFCNDLRRRQSVQPSLLSNMYHDICFVLAFGLGLFVIYTHSAASS